MTLASKATIKTYFVTNATPSQQNFTDFIDSCLFLGESTSQAVSGAVAFAGATAFTGGINANTIAVSGAVTVSGVLAAAGGITVSGASLGTAAFLNVGTGASQVVQMTAASKLPAVDGSLLTNLSTGAMTLLSTQTASNSVTIDFTTGIDSTYKEYVIEIIDMVSSTDAVAFWGRISTDGGVTWKSGGSDYSYFSGLGHSTASTYDSSNSSGASQIVFGPIDVSNAAFGNLALSLRIYNPANAATKKLIGFLGSSVNTSSVLFAIDGSGMYNTAGAINGIRFLMSSGNIKSGVFKLYGVN